jgi:flavin reductase (DIM6/NTAB) family NADH-FMN oxidoreductase RutF
MAVGTDEFKDALSKFASGVTIVTVAKDGDMHGMTASSFASVSLLPPLVLVCLERTSRTRSLVLSSGAFAVNVLADHQEPISRTFSGQGPKTFDSLPHKSGRSGAPLLSEAIAWIECTIHSVIEAGDHDLVIGDVIACDAGEGSPLLYYRRRYRSLGDS